MSVSALKEQHKPFMSDKIHACPLREHWTSFQLVDEFGDGTPYAGLIFEATDYEAMFYTGQLDASGSGKVEHHFNGPIVLTLVEPYKGKEKTYTFLRERPHYPLPITELQVRAEKTRFFNKSGQRTLANPAQGKVAGAVFVQVEVSELVAFHAHLPPTVERHFPPNVHIFNLYQAESQVKMQSGIEGATSATITSTDTGTAELGFSPPPSAPKGIALLSNRHHVLEVRPLRALRPALSTANEFCALNLYQLALMATLSYSPFGQRPETQPVTTSSVGFPSQPACGNWFGEALPCFAELWQVDTTQAGGKAYYPLYEEVPYSKRLEIMPFDPELYPFVNDPALGEKQENPANLHFFDDSQREGGTNTQAFITHHDELILIAVRGTAEGADILRDIDAEQVPFKEGVGKVHNGFYGAAKAIQGFVTDYLEKFHNGQKIVITGHSLGGAITLLLSEMLRRREGFNYDILLYTYGSPRAADKTFVEGAAALVHHRTVNHNDPVPSVPATWMNTDKPLILTGKAALILINPVVGTIAVATGLVNFTGRSYEHHGTLRHFMPVKFEDGHESSVLWTPMCSSITDQGCAKALSETDGLPVRGNFLHQILNSDNHMMVASYIPNCWATLRRWQESQEMKRPLITDREFDGIKAALDRLTDQLQALQKRLRTESNGDGYDYRGENERAIIVDELYWLNITRDRLISLRASSVAESEVYGLLTSKPELQAEMLPRWKAHPENIKQEQWAMIPPPADTHDRAIAAITGARVVGSPFNLDVDALI
ncbi:lipase family protein [Pseudomonas sp. OV226]|uniref:lipase family protein n=1 Tax=Pseudomonas sp. OV226 TaxID=2135588 RepID=UPI000D6B21AE|nr:lipase family protein [Pseudomonas sp. OV226]PWK44806.1 lipase (class 3) [Pseudomonas sp. OV226]